MNYNSQDQTPATFALASYQNSLVLPTSDNVLSGMWCAWHGFRIKYFKRVERSPYMLMCHFKPNTFASYE